MDSIYDFSVKTIKHETMKLDAFKGQVLLIVNTASQCGFTKQYEGLEQVYQRLGARKFSVLGFPCNQFGGQEPGTEAEIQKFCELNYKVSFPLFAKIDVNGDATDPLYQFLKAEGKGILGTEAIKWNFTKFLINASGQVVKRFAPQTDPLTIVPEIEALLT